MTIREYISQKLGAFGLSEAYYHDVVLSSGLAMDDSYTAENAEKVGKAMITLIEEVMFIPRQSSISESGFSVSWDFESLGKWYLVLCRRYGVAANQDVLAMTGISSIIDMSDIW